LQKISRILQITNHITPEYVNIDNLGFRLPQKTSQSGIQIILKYLRILMYTLYVMLGAIKDWHTATIKSGDTDGSAFTTMACGWSWSG